MKPVAGGICPSNDILVSIEEGRSGGRGLDIMEALEGREVDIMEALEDREVSKREPQDNFHWEDEEEEEEEEEEEDGDLYGPGVGVGVGSGVGTGVGTGVGMGVGVEMKARKTTKGGGVKRVTEEEQIKQIKLKMWAMPDGHAKEVVKNQIKVLEARNEARRRQ